MPHNAIVRSFLSILSLFVDVSASGQAPPRIEAIFNNYSFIQPGLPNYGIAQGSIFRILGPNIGGSTASQGVPLRTELAAVTINVSVSGVTTQAIPYFVSDGTIIAILPSSTPVGDGTITITSAGQPGSAPIHVVQSAFGLLTDPVSGATAVARDHSGRFLSQIHAARPGAPLTLWGSGLGPVSGDETQYQPHVDLTNIPIQVDIGGVSATVTYHGRSPHPGVDRIDVIVPAGVSGCNVSVVVVVGGVPSNFATIPVALGSRRNGEDAPNDRICSDPGLIPVTPGEYRKLLKLPEVHLGTISLTKLTTTGSQAGSATSDSASATLQKETARQFASASFLQQASIGGCLVVHTGPTLLGWKTFKPLNAGPQMNVNGPDGSVALLPLAPHVDASYVEPIGTSTAIIPSTGGAFTFDNGSGGPDVGPFEAKLNVSLATPLVWTNRPAITEINRATGQLIKWTGGLPGSYVNIFGYSSVHQFGHFPNGSTLYAYFTCSAPASAEQFTVPAAVLNSLPPSAGGYLYVANGTAQRFSAPGLDLGLLFFTIGSGISIPFI